MKNIIRKIFFTLLFTVQMLPAAARGGTRADSVYRCIDKAIDSTDVYIGVREARIGIKRDGYHAAKGHAARYAAAMDLYSEYRPYMNDSALIWLSRAEDEARLGGNPAGVNHCRVLTAYQCSTTGMYTEAGDILALVDKQALTHEGLIDYYMACNHLYNDLGYYTKIEFLRKEYYTKAGLYADSLISTAGLGEDIALELLETRAYNAGDLKTALSYSDMRLRLAAPDSHSFAVVAFYRYLDYKMLEDTDEWTYWLAMSVLNDVRNAVMDQAAMWELANHMLTTGDIERSYRYINFASECALRFNTRLRNYQITPIMQAIDNIYQIQSRKENTYLKIAIALTTLVMLLVLVFVAYLNRQRRRLAQARNELSDKNGQLTALNADLKHALDELDTSNRQLTSTGYMLADAVAGLDESNRVKEKYIGLFLRHCSKYIDRMDAMRKEFAAMMKNKRYAELYDLLRRQGFRDREQEELFEIFDSTFIRLFPTFVDEFNMLLTPENRIHLADQSRLTTGIRIFALIRLGIDDSSKIAEFLHYSVNTIYNYRAKIKNGAAVDRDEFENLVKSIGQPPKASGGGKINNAGND